MDLAVITGAAGGMGAPSAVRFAAQGRPLLLCDLDAGRLEQVAAPLRADGATVDILAADIADPDFPAHLLAAIGERPVHALIHTAGLSPSMAAPDRIIEVNYFAAERLVAAILPRMATGGCAVLISSTAAYMAKSTANEAAVAALVGGQGPDAALALCTSPQAAYPLSKQAIIALVAREATAFGARGARIASIAPGFIDTGMGRAEMEASQTMVAMTARTPLRRLGLGDEIASVAVFLCSADASYITGCDIKVDGGALAALGF